jgi:hypothetical protein
MLEFEISLISKVIQGISRLSDHHILDPNSPFPIGIVPWLVREDMTDLEWCVVVCYSETYTLGSFVDIQERTDAVTCTMSAKFSLNIM